MIKIAWFCLWVIICAATAFANATGINQLSAVYQSKQQQLSVDPEAILQQPINAKSTELNQAQHALLLSQAYYALTYPHQALQQAQAGLSYIDAVEQPWLYHQLRLAESLAFDSAGQPAKGLPATVAALTWAKQRHDTALQLDALYAKGIILNSLVDYSAALSDLQQAYTLIPQTGSITSRGQVASMIALVYEYRHEPDLSIPFFEEAVAYHRQHQQWLELSIALYGLGKANKDIGQLETGQKLLQESIQYARKVNDIQGVAYGLKELAGVNMRIGQYIEAEKQLLAAAKIFDKAQNAYMQLDVASSLLVLALQRNEPALAKQYLQRARQYLDPQSMPIQKISLDEKSARVTAALGDFEQAYHQLAKTVQQKQQIYSTQSTEQLHQLRSHYELEAKEQKNQLLERQNELQKVNLVAQQQQNIHLWAMFGFTLLICFLLGVMVYRNQQNKQRLLRLANVDGLTGLLNRRKTMELLQLQFDLAVRHQFELCLVIVDLDYFKQINDQFGHAAGDKVLSQFGQLCSHTFRHTDIVGRIGGEEFLIALPHTDQQATETILDALREKTHNLSSSLEIDALNVSVSCGLCVYQQQSSMEEMLAQADSALYQAKQQGRNRVEIFTHNHNQHLLPV